jgi:hypothetical protein
MLFQRMKNCSAPAILCGQYEGRVEILDKLSWSCWRSGLAKPSRGGAKRVEWKAGRRAVRLKRLVSEFNRATIFCGLSTSLYI